MNFLLLFQHVLVNKRSLFRRVKETLQISSSSHCIWYCLNKWFMLSFSRSVWFRYPVGGDYGT